MELFYREFGNPGEGKIPMVILHGVLGSSRNWQTVADELAKAGVWVFALDMRNHGKSFHDEEMNYGVMARDLHEWLKNKNFKKVILMGHSMGGKTAMLFACQHPEMLERLIVVDILPRESKPGYHENVFQAMFELPLDRIKNRGEAEAFMERHIDSWEMRKFLSTNLERLDDGTWRWQINLDAINRARSGLRKNPLQPEMRYEGPVLLIAGEYSFFTKDGSAEDMHPWFPAAERVTIEGTGHNPHINKRAEFVDIVRSWCGYSSHEL